MKNIYIILPVHDRKNVTLEFVNCLLNQDYQNYHLILVDDGSRDGTSDAILSIMSKEKVTVIRGKGKWLWAGGLQQGYLYLKKLQYNNSDYVLIINDDTVFGNNFLSNGVKILQKERKVLLLAENYNSYKKSFEEGGIRADWKELEFYITKNESEINCLSTRGLMMGISDFIELKGFHPILIPHYLADYEFSYRAYTEGYRLLTQPGFFLYFNKETTRNTEKNINSLLDLFKHKFSRKSPEYIIAWTSFIILSCPMRYKIKHLVKLWLFPILYFLIPIKKKYIRKEKGFLK